MRHTRDANGKRVSRVQIIGTTCFVFTAWEPSSLTGEHSVLTHIEDRCFGQIGSRRPPPDLDSLPAYSDARYAKVKAFYEAQRKEACDIIRKAFPEAAGGQERDGEIELWSDE